MHGVSNAMLANVLEYCTLHTVLSHRAAENALVRIAVRVGGSGHLCIFPPHMQAVNAKYF